MSDLNQGLSSSGGEMRDELETGNNFKDFGEPYDTPKVRRN